MPLEIDRTTFFSYARNAPFGGSLSQARVNGLNAILDAWDRFFPDGDIRWLAYALATAYHETGARMQPVRETFASSDAAAVRALDRAYARGQLTWVRSPYWDPDETGLSWFGRGLVQITHKVNYEKMRPLVMDAFGVDIVAEPNLTLRLDIAAFILLEGSLDGASNRADFTSKGLEDYFNDSTDDPLGARRVINGTDKASLIAGYYRCFLDSLTAAEDAFIDDERPPSVREEDAEGDDIPATSSGGLISAGSIATAAPVVSQFVGGIDSGIGAAVLIAGLAVAAGIFVWLVKTDRIVFLKPKTKK